MKEQKTHDASGPRMRATSAAAITPTAPDWLWRGWVLRRALNLVTGRQGSGKTSFAAHLTAALTRGEQLPGGSVDVPCAVGFLSLEEPHDRVVARLTAAGADLDRVVILGDVDDVTEDGRPFSRRWRLPGDVAVLGEAITEYCLDLVVIDGLGYSVTGDSHNYAIVGASLAALAAEADRTGAAIVGLTHPPKGAADPVTAAIGSTAWTSIPRISIVLGKDPADETGTTRVVSVGKSNYKMPSAALAFTLAADPELECGVVSCLRPTTVSAEQILAAPPTSEELSERAEAREFVREALADGPMPAADLERAAEAAGISAATLRRARRDLGVVARRARDAGTGRTTGWIIELPDALTARDEHLEGESYKGAAL